MQREPVMQRIRAGIVRVLRDLGYDAPEPLQETLLLQNGHYCGRRFRRDGVSAVWFHEEGEVKFYAVDGSLLAVHPVDHVMEPEDMPSVDRRVA